LAWQINALGNVIIGTYLGASNVNPTKMTEDEILCAKNIVRERDPDAFATSAKEMGNAALDSG